MSRVPIYTQTRERINAVDASPSVSTWVAMTFVYVWKHQYFMHHLTYVNQFVYLS